jgi:hypothetical protein
MKMKYIVTLVAGIGLATLMAEAGGGNRTQAKDCCDTCAKAATCDQTCTQSCGKAGSQQKQCDQACSQDQARKRAKDGSCGK